MFSDSDIHHITTQEYAPSEEGSPPQNPQRPLIRDQERDQYPGTRRPIPVSTIDLATSMTSHYAPLNGLDFLGDANQLIIQQTVELNDLMSNVASENRYIVKIPRGDTIYYATETSEGCQRTCFGSNRSFEMHLYDATQQEAITLKRRLACGACCSLFCYLQELEVWVPPGDQLGTIKQYFHMTKPCFSITNMYNEVLYTIEGPDSLMGCFTGQKQNFQIYNRDGSTQVGSIIHQWDQVQVEYNLYLQMPGNLQDKRQKALLLGAAFLLEYMYFENTKKRKLCCC